MTASAYVPAIPARHRASSSAPTVIGGYALAVARALDQYGVHSPPIFRAAGISMITENNPLVRVPLENIEKLFRICEEVTKDSYFRLTAGRFIRMSNLHAFGHGLAASATLLDFCRRIERNFRIASQADAPSLTIDAREVKVSRKLIAPMGKGLEDTFAASVIRLMRHLYKAEFNPLRVGFMHARPREGAGPYETLFRAPVTFDQGELSIVFARSSLEQPLNGACADLAQINDNVATHYLALLDKSDVIAQVRHAVTALLQTGNSGRDKVAQRLHLSPATLQYKLMRRNTTFQTVLDETRRDLACSYLKQPGRSITEVALNVGFTDTSNFTRAFKRWTGVSPTDYRCEHSA